MMRKVCFFFFFKQKTAYEMAQCDWSSDVCSSDLWRPRRRPLLADTPTRLLATLAGAVAAGLLLADRIPLPPGALRVVGVAAGQGALLATALAWAGCGTRSGVVAIVVLVAAAVATTLDPAGALGYLLVPLWVAWLARSGRLAALGLAGAVPGRAVLAAVLLGA